MAIDAGCSADGQSLAADAFRRLYPDQYFARFVNDGIRPDGRTLGRARATTIGLDTISVADGSALVRVGSTTVLAGVRYSVSRPLEDAPDRGTLSFNVEIAPFSSADWRPGKAPELVSYVTERLGEIMRGPRPPLELSQLCIAESKACWAADMNIYILNSDGSVLDTALLALIAALASSTLPATTVTPEGDIRMADKESAEEPICDERQSKGLVLACTPLALTCATYGDHLLADPTAEEESMSSSSITVVLDESNVLHGVYKAGGSMLATPKLMTRCIESAKLRYKEQRELLRQALLPAPADEDSGMEQ